MQPPREHAEADSRDRSSPSRGKQATWILVATILGSSMAFIDSTVVNVALPALQKSFGASVLGVQWVVEAYALTLSALILVGGSMGDMFGRRRMFVLGVAIFAAASVYCGLAPSIGHLIAARAVQGIGAAFLVPESLAIISACFEESERGKAIGTWSGATAITTAIGPVLGGWLIEHLSWRWAFFLNLPLALAVIAISLWRVPESRSSEQGGIDYLGASAITFSLTALTFGMIESSRLGWRHPLVVATLAGGLAGLLAFVFVESRVESPMVPLPLFRSRAFSGANLLTLFLYSALSIFFFVFPLDLIQVQGYSATEAGLAVLPFIVLVFLLSRWSGGLVSRYGARKPLMIGPAIAALGFFLFSIPSAGGGYWHTFFLPVITLGLGMAVSVAPLTTTVMDAVDQDRVGTASGINNAVSRVAGVLAVAGLGAAMVITFGNHLNRRLESIAVPDDVRSELQRNEIKMAALTVPATVEPETAAAIREAIISSFIGSFRLMMWISSALALLSSAAAWLLVPGGAEPSYAGARPQPLPQSSSS